MKTVGKARKKVELDSGIGNIPQRRGTLQVRKAVSRENTEVR